MARLPAPPDLEWDAQGAPFARAFNDVYFSRAGGLSESRAVFLQGCGLPERWRGRRSFSILELGFGAGLNALAAQQAWSADHLPGAILHFVSIEAFPMSAADARRALGAFPDIAHHADRLLAAWPARARGAQRLWFDDFALTLIVADVRDALAEIEGRFDAVFLDGFSPAGNAAMWTPELLHRIAALCAPEARAATYSVAGAVRRGLEGAGFAVEKRPGFAGKRERLEARLVKPQAEPAPRLWPYRAASEVRDVAIVGGGIAGAAAAAAFARRGARITIYDAGVAEPAPVALMAPRLDRDDLAPSRLYRAAYLEALRTYEPLGVLRPVGVEEWPTDEGDVARVADFAHDPPLDQDLLLARENRLFHLRAGTLQPAEVIAALAQGARRARQRVQALQREAGVWRLTGEGGRMLGSAHVVVLCAGAQLARFAQTRWLPLEYSRGQIDWGAPPGAVPARAIVSGAYLAPYADQIVFGATFDRQDEADTPGPDAGSTARNLAALGRIAPESAAGMEVTGSWAGVRASVNDRMPIAGLAPDGPAWAARFASLKDGRAPADMAEPAPAHEDLYVIGALGARGFTLAPILAERVAAEASGEPQALDAGVLAAIHPARFLIRALKRGLPLAF